jgi:hypothetical protein
MSQRFTREEFYELVWSKPMTHLAKDFRLSDVALHKICRKHDIPNPPLGWWAKHAAGHKVKRIPLPKTKAGVALTVVIASGEIRQEPANLAAAREQARVKASEFDLSGEVLSHPLVQKSFDKLRKAKPGNTGLVSLSSDGHVQLEIAPASIDRAEHCLIQIVAAAKAQGFELSAKASKAAFTNGSVSIPFAIKEAYKRIKHVPTAEEIAEDERRQRRRSRDWSRSDWTPHSFSFGRPEWDYVPTGQLAFEFDIYLRYASQVRRAFKDAKLQRLENLAPDITVGLAVLAAAKAEDDQKAEEERLREEEAKRRRIEAQRLAYIAERRDKVLEDVLARLERRDRLAAFVTRLEEELAGEQATRVAEFVAWARTKLSTADQRISAAGLDELFLEQHVFGGDDDRGFYPKSYW